MNYKSQNCTDQKHMECDYFDCSCRCHAKVMMQRPGSDKMETIEMRQIKHTNLED